MLLFSGLVFYREGGLLIPLQTYNQCVSHTNERYNNHEIILILNAYFSVVVGMLLTAAAR
jgi:hypothetical protein